MVTLESSLAETEFPTSSFKIRNRYKIQNRTFLPPGVWVVEGDGDFKRKGRTVCM